MSTKQELEDRFSHCCGRLYEIFKDSCSREDAKDKKLNDLAACIKKYIDVVEDVIPESTFELNGALCSADAELSVKLSEITVPENKDKDKDKVCGVSLEYIDRTAEQLLRVSEKMMKDIALARMGYEEVASYIIGETKVYSAETVLAHVLCQRLEQLAPSEFASALCSSGWELLRQIGRYEDGFELGEGEGHQ